jgi:uncharacterized protein
MEIRSVTLFVDPDTMPTNAADFLADARQAFPVAVQTTRVATSPFPNWLSAQARPIDAVAAVGDQWRAAGADYVSLGPVQMHHHQAWIDLIPEIIQAHEGLFATIEIADQTGQINVGRCWAAAEVIRRLSLVSDDGFANLYLAAIANCPPGSPFFPVAYHDCGPASFALATQAADLARQAFQAATTLDEARQLLVQLIESVSAQIVVVAEELAAKYSLPFHGLDFSLAPYPTADFSLAGAMEDLGLQAVGGPGSLFAATFIAEAIGRASFPRCGFSGLMLPVLEDSVLAARTAEGRLSVSDLLSYAAVCGVGLDTIPLPGDIDQAALAGILLDIAALASRLDKPLTARLMPLPGKAAGDAISFDFPYFAGSRVMAVRSGTLSGLLATPQRLIVSPR